MSKPNEVYWCSAIGLLVYFNEPMPAYSVKNCKSKKDGMCTKINAPCTLTKGTIEWEKSNG